MLALVENTRQSRAKEFPKGKSHNKGQLKEKGLEQINAVGSSREKAGGSLHDEDRRRGQKRCRRGGKSSSRRC